jgi:hypothetical protein
MNVNKRHFIITPIVISPRQQNFFTQLAINAHTNNKWHIIHGQHLKFVKVLKSHCTNSMAALAEARGKIDEDVFNQVLHDEISANCEEKFKDNTR